VLADEPECPILALVVDSMSLEEQVAQLFILGLGSETDGFSMDLARFVAETQAGGYILFSDNITTVEDTRNLTDAIRIFSHIPPFIGIDEEGGTVSRLRVAGLPGYTAQPSARDIGRTGDVSNAYASGVAIGEALDSIGVNLNFAPVADVLTNPNNTVIGSRAFGSDPEIVADMASAFQAGLHSTGVLSSPKHFPGHGNTADDSHFGSAVIASDAQHLREVEFVPFERLISEGAEFIMTGHVLVPEVEPDGLPATLSEYFMTDVLRGELGFEGIIITDAMNMGAIAHDFTASEAAVLAIKAGVDMILMPESFSDAMAGIIEAVENEVIPRERIRESLFRIFTTKQSAGILLVAF